MPLSTRIDVLQACLRAVNTSSGVRRICHRSSVVRLSPALHNLAQSKQVSCERYGFNLLHSRHLSRTQVRSHNATGKTAEDAGNPSGADTKPARATLRDGPGLEHFIANSVLSEPSTDLSALLNGEQVETIPYLPKDLYKDVQQKVYFDVYGCQMNVNDAEVVWSILQSNGYVKTEDRELADIILVVTCAIREGAETKVWNKLQYLKSLKTVRARTRDKLPLKIGVLGCMAERLKAQLLERERAVDVVAGPDSYRDLPRLLALTRDNQTAVNVILSADETYADVMPVRMNPNSVSAYVSIMRGCDNMCSYCIVPFTRGRERSRPLASILEEVRHLSDQGVREVTLLGQNVNSYRDLSETQHSLAPETQLAKGFKTVYKTKRGGLRFADLLEKVSDIDPEMRIRFTSPHPKDFPDAVLDLIRERSNVCRSIHLPAQSGSSAVLERMRRGYTREAYLELVQHVRRLVPGVALSSDFICGFCGETEQDFEQTLSMLREVKYNAAFLFPYSLREKTHAHRRLQDDVEQEVKLRRMREMVAVYRSEVERLNQAQIGSRQLILVEGLSKRSSHYLAGRNEANVKVIFPAGEIPASSASPHLRDVHTGDYIAVQVNAANSQVLKGIPLYHSSVSTFDSPDAHLATSHECLNVTI